MNPLIILAGVGAVGYGIYQATKKQEFQVTQSVTTNGTPIKIAVPVPSSVNKAQAVAQVLAKYSGPKKIVNVKLPYQGFVQAPMMSIQPDNSGSPQPTPIIISPTGSSSMSIGSLKDVQRALNTLGFAPSLKEDGVLGPATVANIKAFQSRSKLVVDGNAGTATKAALSAAVSQLASSGSQLSNNPAVQNPAPVAMTNSALQKNLNILGAKPSLVTDGKFGPMTVAAIKAFQASHGLAVDGIAGPKTKAAIQLAVNPS
jgi:peptidoglycan hydrolase-like protein with peptidoglycan-binding domain